jgi:hypothetical protein
MGKKVGAIIMENSKNWEKLIKVVNVGASSFLPGTSQAFYASHTQSVIDWE